MSTKEALLFPVIASVTLFSIYVIFQVIIIKLKSSKNIIKSYIYLFLWFRYSQKIILTCCWHFISSCWVLLHSQGCSGRNIHILKLLITKKIDLNIPIYIYNFLFKSPLIKRIWPSFLIENCHYDFTLSFLRKRETQQHSDALIDLRHAFGTEVIVGFLISLAIGSWYIMKKVK